MLIIGSGSFLADLLTSISLDFKDDEIAIYNDLDNSYPDYVRQNFLVLENENDVEKYFEKTDKRFIVAIGDNQARENISQKYEALGGQNISFISSRAVVGKFAKIADKGVIVMHYTCISNEAEIGEGTIVYLQCGLGHFSNIGKYCFLSSSIVMSNTTIGNYCNIGIGVKFVPGNSLGVNCKVGTGAVITKSFNDNAIIAGNPAKIFHYEN